MCSIFVVTVGFIIGYLSYRTWREHSLDSEWDFIIQTGATRAVAEKQRKQVRDQKLRDYGIKK